VFQRFVVFSVCLNFSRVGTDEISVSSDLNFLSEGLCKVPTSQDFSISRPGTVFPPIRILWKHWSWGLNPGPSWWEAKGWPTGPLRLCVNAVKLQALTWLPPSSRLGWLWSWKEDLQRVWNRDKKLCEVKWDYHIVGTTAKWQFETKLASDKATMINHVRVTNVARQG
jgi:hypothetical protein